MKKAILGVLAILLVIPVYAAELTPEAGCCLNFERGLTLPKECNQYEINDERCDDIIARYKAARDAPVYMAIAIVAVLIFIAYLIWHIIKKKRK